MIQVLLLGASRVALRLQCALLCLRHCRLDGCDKAASESSSKRGPRCKQPASRAGRKASARWTARHGQQPANGGRLENACPANCQPLPCCTLKKPSKNSHKHYELPIAVANTFAKACQYFQGLKGCNSSTAIRKQQISYYEAF